MNVYSTAPTTFHEQPLLQPPIVNYGIMTNGYQSMAGVNQVFPTAPQFIQLPGVNECLLKEYENTTTNSDENSNNQCSECGKKISRSCYGLQMQIYQLIRNRYSAENAEVLIVYVTSTGFQFQRAIRKPVQNTNGTNERHQFLSTTSQPTPSMDPENCISTQKSNKLCSECGCRLSGIFTSSPTQICELICIYNLSHANDGENVAVYIVYINSDKFQAQQKANERTPVTVALNEGIVKILNALQDSRLRNGQRMIIFQDGENQSEGLKKIANMLQYDQLQSEEMENVEQDDILQNEKLTNAANVLHGNQHRNVGRRKILRDNGLQNQELSYNHLSFSNGFLLKL